MIPLFIMGDLIGSPYNCVAGNVSTMRTGEPVEYVEKAVFTPTPNPSPTASVYAAHEEGGA